MKKDTFAEEREYQKNLFERIKRVIEHRLERNIDFAKKECEVKDENVIDFTQKLINVAQYKGKTANDTTDKYEYTESDEEIPEEPNPDEPIHPEPEPEPIEPEPTSIEGRKILKQMQIDEYDQSSNVNGFYLGDQLMWLDRETRASLRNTIESLLLLGRTELDIWYGTTRITLDVNTAKQLLAVLEVYATDCYNVTIQHKIAVENLTDIDDVINFDITADYPEMPHFPLSE